MAASPETVSMAMFCDFENVALGVRDANFEKFDIKPVLERLLLKGSIVLKKAYCDWDRYKGFKATMHEANFELIEIPHVRQSGKNSADIRMVVDALDLCYTKSHVNTFVIVSGDSDFSPLVSKLSLIHIYFLDRNLHERCGVVWNVIGDAFREELRQLLDLVFNRRGGGQGVGAGGQADGQGGGRLAVVATDDAVRFGAEFDARHIT